MSKHKFGDQSTVSVQILADVVNDLIIGGTPGKSQLFVEQFMYRLLTPKASKFIVDILGWDPTTKESIMHPHLESNKLQERLVMGFLDKARQGKTNTVMSSYQAERLYKDIINQHKTALTFEHNPSLKGVILRI